MNGGLWYTAQTSGNSYDGYGGTFKEFETLSDGYARYYKDITVPEGKTKAKIYIQLEQKSDNLTTAWNVADMHIIKLGAAATIPKGSTGNKSYTAYWIINQYTLTINPNGGSYNSKTANTTITQNYNTTYGMPNPTRTGYTFSGWTLSGKGSLIRENASSTPSSASSTFTQTEKTDTDGSKYTNFTLNYTNSGTGTTYPSISWPAYSYVSGHQYRISAKVRVNEISGMSYAQFRHSAFGNDWGSTGWQSFELSASSNFVEHSITRTFTGTTIEFNGTKTISPRPEFYCAIAAGKTGKLNFDVKELTIYDVTAGTYISSGTYGGYGYKFADGNGTVTAKWTANELTFGNQSKSVNYNSTAAQNVAITAATNGTGTYTYSISSQKNSSGTTVSNFTISGTNVVVAKGTTAGTYTVVVKATDSNSAKTKEATYTITVNKIANPITVTASQSWSEAFATSAKDKAIASSGGQGTLSYAIQSQKDKNGTAVTYFEISGSNLRRKANTPVNVSNYTVVVRVTAAGNDNYNSGYKDITYTVTVTKATNPIAVTATQSWSATFGTGNQDKSFTAATSAQGAVTYSIKSQKNKDGTAVTNFSIPTAGTAKLRMAGSTPVNKSSYTVVITATAAGNANYNSGTKDITMTVTVGKAANPLSVTATQSWSTAYTTSTADKAITSSGGQGTLSYAIQSQKDKNGTAVTYFEINGSNLRRKASTPVNVSKYTVVVRVTAAGNDNYNSAYKDITYTVTVQFPKLTLNGNGGTTLQSEVYPKYGTTSEYTSATSEATGETARIVVTRSGYTLLGWYTASSGGTKVLDAGGNGTGTAVSGYTNASKQWVMTADKTLYAQWKENNYEGRTRSGTTLEYYATLNEAFATTNGAVYEIRPLKDVIKETEDVIVPSKTIMLGGDAKIEMNKHTIKNNGTLTILGIHIDATESDIAIENTGDLNFQGSSKVTTNGTGVLCTGSGSINNIGGTINSTGVGIDFRSTGSLKMNDNANITADDDAIKMKSGSLSYFGGETYSSKIAISLNGSENVKITNGKITGDHGVWVANGASPTIVIEGGEIYAHTRFGVTSDGTASVTIGKTDSSSTQVPMIQGKDSGVVMFSGTATMNCGILKGKTNARYGSISPRTGYHFVHGTEGEYKTVIVQPDAGTKSSTSTANKAMSLQSIKDIMLTTKLNNDVEKNIEDTDNIESTENAINAEIDSKENVINAETESTENAINAETESTENAINTETDSTISKIVQINETTYSTISEAIASANSGEQIELLEDISLNEEVIIEKDKNIIINLNGKNLTSASANTINNEGILKIVGTGSIKNEVDNGVVINNNGSLKIEKGIITTAKNSGKCINNNGKLEISGGKIISEGINSSAIYNNYKSEAIIKAGTIEVKGTESKGIYNNSSLTIAPTNTVKIIVSSEGSIGIYNSEKSTVCDIKSTEILIESDVIENYESIKDTDEFKAKLEQMKPSYGIYNNSNISVNIEGLTMKVERLKGVGIQNNAEGTITIGKLDGILNESDPIIYATSDNTTAIVNANTQKGRIKFYDGSFITTKSIENEITDMLEGYEILEIKNDSIIKSILIRKEE